MLNDKPTESDELRKVAKLYLFDTDKNEARLLADGIEILEVESADQKAVGILN